MNNVIPIRDLHRETSRLVDNIAETLSNTPADGLEPGYLISAQTQVDLCRAIALLREAYHFLRRAQEREDSIYNAYYDSRHPEEALLP